MNRTFHGGRGPGVVPGVGLGRRLGAAGPGWQRWALNIGAVLGSLCLVLAALTLVLGIKPLIFASGSMGPGIPTGSLGLAISTPAADAVPGQVVSVVTSDGTRITHRLVSRTPDGGLILKGDANAVADLQPYMAQTVDRLFFSVPVLGFVASALGQPWVYFLGGLLCAMLVYLAFVRKDAGTEGGAGSGNGAGKGSSAGPGARLPREQGPDSPLAGSVPGSGPVQRRADWGRYSSLSVPAETPAGGFGIIRRLARRRTLQGTVAVLAALAIVVPAGFAARAEPTQASFTGSAAAKASVTAATMPAPTTLSCSQTADKESVDFNWKAPVNSPVPPIGYRLSVLVGGKSNSETLASDVLTERLSMQNANGLLGAVLSLLVDILSILIPYSYPVTVSVVAIYPNGWESAPATYDTLVAANKGALFGGKMLTC
ncbi:S24/S26 family peptidase [Arthrobacter sp. ERGS1:01]|uniref:S24/S26 family peptidase n=1 Tax=Arthrobacter sp. ERGS1:01 TaxID=1704044 RepID=UPI00123750BB|nr:S24/S26 family peptidase [Arthrobacter sp. ERGS1:01]